MNKFGHTISSVFGVFFILFAVISPAVFASSVAAAPALDVSGAEVVVTMKPGDTYTHQMKIQNNSAGPLDMQVEAMGFGQTLDGSYTALAKEEDKSPYSAREFITSIDKPSFRLEPGAAQTVSAALTIPAGVTGGIRYAIIYIHSLASGEGKVGMIVAANVTVRVTTPTADTTKKGEIQSVEINPVQSGEPVVIKTIFKNTGAYHYRIKNEITVKDEAGKTFLSSIIPVTGTSLIPTFSWLFTASLFPSDPTKGLPIGKYTVESRVLADDGAQLSVKTADFTIAEEYKPLPGVTDKNIVVKEFKNEIPAKIDAIKEADTTVEITGTGGPVTGKVIVSKYSSVPKTTIRFEALRQDGGMGVKAIKYVDVRVEGFTVGTARVTVYFTEDESIGINTNSMLLAYFDGTSWRKLSNLQVFTGAGYIVGDIACSALTGTIIGLGGESTAATVAATPTSFFSVSWWIVVAIIVPLIIIGALIFFWKMRNR
jgi:hypothetical protein